MVGRDIPLGRIAGVKVGFSWSVILIAGLYTVTLATNRFPIEQPGLSDSLYWAAGIGGALLFFASLLAHEIGHALNLPHHPASDNLMYFSSSPPDHLRGTGLVTWQRAVVSANRHVVPGISG